MQYEGFGRTTYDSPSDISKREYFAAIALQALIARNDDPLIAALLNQNPNDFDLTKLEWIARLKAKAAVIYADALLAELAQ